jgi:DNA repair exonuclease SbcCD ATPase subunit
MFDIHTITLVNFRSYKGTHKFEFPKTTGLYYLTGKNRLEPALGANGSGKSTFLDAITWVLYGHTTRGLKASDILSWHVSAGAQVVIELTVGGQRHTVKRSQKPNSLLIDGKAVDQKELETHLRLNYAAFTHSVLSPQFGKSFFSLGATEKLGLFSDFMGLDLWLTKSDEAAKLAREKEALTDKLRGNINRFEGQREVIEADIVDLKAKEAAFESDRQAKVEELEAEVLKHFNTNKKAKGAIVVLNVEYAEFQVEIEHERAVLHAAEKRLESVLALIQEESKRKVKCLELIKGYKDRISGFNCLKGETCPTCSQKVDERHVKRVLEDLRDNIDNEEGYLAQSDTVLADLNMILVKHKGAVQVANNTIQDIEDEIKKIVDKIAEKKAQSGQSVRDMDNRVDTLEALKVGQNPYTATLDAKRQRIGDIDASLGATTQDLDTVEAELEATRFWVKGFKRIRLFIIEQAFQTLELEVNNCLAQLGMTDWQVTFDVERENKSGGVTKGFVVLIKGPSNTEPVKWENWSGGETQRLQLAGDLGLANLIMQHAGLRSEIELYDEPSTHLSPEGMMDLADTLHERAVSEGKRIWIADHAAISNYGSFEGVILARKDENGSSIIAK